MTGHSPSSPPRNHLCGQLAVAIALERLSRGLAPGHEAAAAALGAGGDPTDEAAVRALAAEIARTHPPDVPFVRATSAFRVRAALEDRGVPAHIAHTGAFGRSFRQVWDLVQRAALSRLPAIVCLDAGRLGGRRWHAHWCVVTGFDGDLVEIANPVARPYVRVERFHAAWACPHLPWPHHHCAVIPAAPPRDPAPAAAALDTIPSPAT